MVAVLPFVVIVNVSVLVEPTATVEHVDCVTLSLTWYRPAIVTADELLSLPPQAQRTAATAHASFFIIGPPSCLVVGRREHSTDHPCIQRIGCAGTTIGILV